MVVRVTEQLFCREEHKVLEMTCTITKAGHADAMEVARNN
jgi:hypothetical protein